MVKPAPDRSEGPCQLPHVRPWSIFEMLVHGVPLRQLGHGQPDRAKLEAGPSSAPEALGETGFRHAPHARRLDERILHVARPFPPEPLCVLAVEGALRFRRCFSENLVGVGLDGDTHDVLRVVAHGIEGGRGGGGLGPRSRLRGLAPGREPLAVASAHGR